MLALAVVGAPSLGSGELEPVAHVGHLPRPPLVALGLSVAAAEALDNALHLQELGLRISVVLAPCKGALGAPAQVLLEVAHIAVHCRCRLYGDVGSLVVVDVAQRLVYALDALADRALLLAQLRLEACHLADGVLIEERLELGLKAREALIAQLSEHFAQVVRGIDRVVDLPSLLGVVVAVAGDGRGDALAEGPQAIQPQVDPVLQDLADLAFHP
jgi:hypothetical protein